MRYALTFVVHVLLGTFVLGQSTAPVGKKYADLPAESRAAIEQIHKEAAAYANLDRIDFHKAAFAFAYDSTANNGLGMTRDDARKLADELTDLSEAKRGPTLAGLKHGFRYAYASTANNGLGMTSDAARKQALEWAKAPDCPEALAAHKVAFAYAYTSTANNGLGMTADDARKFAAKISPRGDAFKILTLHKKAFAYAYTSTANGGLGLSAGDARAFADKQAGLPTK